MAGIGQQGLVAVHQRLDALGRLVEGGGHLGHLVVARGVHPQGQVAPAKGPHTLLQGFQPARQPPHHRVGPGGHRDEQHRHQRQRAECLRQAKRQGRQRRQRTGPLAQRRAGRVVAQHRPTRAARHHQGTDAPLGIGAAPARSILARRAIGHGSLAGRAVYRLTRRPPAHDAARQPQRAAIVEPHRAWRVGAPLGLAARILSEARDAHATPVVQRHRHAQPARPLVQRLACSAHRRVGTGQRPLHQLGPGGQALTGCGLHTHALLSTCCCHIQPETSANSASAATTVSQMRR